MGQDTSNRFKSPLSILAVVAVIAAVFVWRYFAGNDESHLGEAPAAAQSHKVAAPDESAEATLEAIEYPEDRWNAASIEVAPVAAQPFDDTIEVTGKVAINEERLAHIFPLAEGVVDEVKARLGDQVKKGDVLAIVQSREVGQAKLQLYQDRLKRDQVVAQDQWTQKVVANVQDLIGMIRSDAKLPEIEERFRGRPIGDYRNQLLTAYIGKHTHERTVDRLSPLTESGAVSGKLLIEAESQSNTASTALQSLIEQIQQDAVQEGLRSSHAVKEIQTRVAVDEAALKILGFRDADLQQIDPVVQGEAVSHMPIQAPFDGTIISKDAVLNERVGPDSQIFSIADLSTVWITADIYEEQLPLLQSLRGKNIRIASDVWPNREFAAQVFYTGDLVDPTSRTVTLRAKAENAEGLLKSGMFVRVSLSAAEAGDVLQIPVAALQEHEGKSFVFVYLGGGKFEARSVRVGRRAANSVEILGGLQDGEQIAVQGAFALKSKMLASLLEE